MNVPFDEAVRAWIRVALASFGGPAGQIAVIHRIVVDEKKWIADDRFVHALSYCMLLPGPEAQQLATYIGWLLHGTRGGLTAGLLFILPGFVSILALSILYVLYHDIGIVAAVFYGLKPAVAAIVFEAVLRLRRRALRGALPVAIAAAAFVAIFVFAVPFPIIIAAAAAVGLIAGRSQSERSDREEVPFPRALRTLRVTVLWLLIWLVPVVVLMVVLGPDHVIVREATFFSQVAVVTFGGAYAALSYVAQHTVETLHWLTAGEMLDGLGLAETTPGPLIMVLEFVGFLTAFRAPGTLHPLAAGILGATVSTWVIFAPCFLFIFAGAPYIEALRGHRRLNAAMGGIMAAVVGVVLNLAVWFALHVLFADVRAVEVGPARFWAPVPASLDPAAALIAIAAAIALLRFHAGMFVVLGGGAVLGVIVQLIR